MNEEEINPADTSGGRRIAFFGDSFTEASQVERRFNFMKRMETLLEQKTGEAVQTLNFGCAGYGTDQAYLRYLIQGRQFRPDVVVYVCTMENDVFDVSMDLNKGMIGFKPFYDAKNDTWLPFEKKIRLEGDPGSHVWYRKSHVYTMKRIGMIRLRDWRRRNFGKIKKTPLPLHWTDYYVPMNKDWENAWRTLEILTKKFKEAAESDGAAFVLILVPSRFQIHPDYWEEIERKHLIEGRVDLFQPTRTMLDISKRIGTPALDLYPPMKLAATGAERLYFSHDGHFTLKGNDAVANAMAEFIRPYL